MIRALSFLLVAALGAPAMAQPALDVQAAGVSYKTFTEPGAPTINVLVIGEGTSDGVYRLAEGTTLTELIALGGGVPRSEETDRRIVESRVRVLRLTDGVRVAIYDEIIETAIREPQVHPALVDGDVVEVDVTLEVIPAPFTVLDGIEVASRVVSFATLILLIVTGSRSL